MRIRVESDFPELYRAAQGYAVVNAWAAAGIFNVLSDGIPRALETLPGHPRALSLSAPILVHLGLLVKHGNHIALTRTGRELLTSMNMTLQGTEWALGDLSRLEAVLREGGPARGPDGRSRVTEGGVQQDDPAATRRFLEVQHRLSAPSADEVGRWLAPRLPPGARVLDLGGGHGQYAHVLTRHGFHVTLFDREPCVAFARERFGAAFAYQSGDFFTDDMGGPYNAVFLSNIVHGLGPAGCAVLFQRLRDVLTPGGLLVLKDRFVDEHGAGPVEAIFSNLTMLLYTQEGQSYTVDEACALVMRAGFMTPEHLYVPDLQFSLLFSRR